MVPYIYPPSTIITQIYKKIYIIIKNYVYKNIYATKKQSVLPDSVPMVRIVYAINSVSYLNQRQKQDLIGRMLVDQETDPVDEK